jgi:hypothetical protein
VSPFSVITLLIFKGAAQQHARRYGKQFAAASKLGPGTFSMNENYNYRIFKKVLIDFNHFNGEIN